MSARRRAIGNGAGLAALLLVAGVISHGIPDETTRDAPFEVRGALGESLTGRNLSATVSGAQFVRHPWGEVWGEPWAADTTGVWLVVGAEVACVVSQCHLHMAQLAVDGTLWSASERPDSLSLAEAPLAAGIPTAGSLLFEVPAELAREAAAAEAPMPAELRLGDSLDERLDSVLVIDIDLAALNESASLEIAQPEWARR